MIDSIGNSTSLVSSKSAQTALRTTSLRSPDVLTAVQQTQQNRSGATAPVRVFSVPQSSQAGTSSPTKLPRGSLVDVLA